MKHKLFTILSLAILLFLLPACGASEADIATAIAQTETAKPTSTFTSTSTPEPTSTQTPEPTQTLWPTF